MNGLFVTAVAVIMAVRASVAAIWRPLSDIPVWKWAEDNIYLPPSLSPGNPGQFKSSLIPYCRAWLECFRDRSIRRVVLCTGAQAGKTITIMIGVAWRLVHRNCNAIWIMPDRQLVTDFSKNRWQILVAENPVLENLRAKAKRWFTNLSQKFALSMLWFGWAGSASQLSSRPAELLIGDELDKFKEGNKKEARARFLLIERAKTIANPLIFFTSTPSWEDGDIWQEFLLGTQEYYHVPCPNCREFIRLEFTEETVRWDGGARDEDGDWDMARVRKSAHYVCPLCQGKIVDDQKPAMLMCGEWRVTNPKADPANRSFHLESIYSPWSSCTFGALAVTFLTMKRQPGGMHNFSNAYRAMPHKIKIRHTKGGSIDEIVKHSPQYILSVDPDTHLPSTVIPRAPLVVWMGVDVSSREYPYVIRAICADESSYLLAEGEAGSWANVMAIAKTKFRVEGSTKRIAVSAIFVDSGFEAKKTIYDICQKWWRFVHPMKGGKHPVPISMKEFTWKDPQRRLELTHYTDSTFKEALYIDKIRDRELPGWFLPKNISQVYKDQLSAEKLEEEDGKTTWKRTGANHRGDCEKLILVAMAKYASTFAAYRKQQKQKKAAKAAAGSQQPVMT